MFGFILSAAFALVWNRYVPSPELTKLRELDNAVDDLSSRYFPDKSNLEALDEMADALARLEERAPKDPSDEVKTNVIEAFGAWHQQYPNLHVTVTVRNAATPNTTRVARNTLELLKQAGVAARENTPYMYLLSIPEHSLVVECHPSNAESIAGLLDALSLFVEGNPGFKSDVEVGRNVIILHYQGEPRFTQSGRVIFD